MQTVRFTIHVGARNSEADLSELLGNHRQVFLERDRDRGPVATVAAIEKVDESFVVDLQFPDRDVDPYANAIGQEISPQSARLWPYYSSAMGSQAIPPPFYLTMVVLSVDDEILTRCRRISTART